MRSSSRRFRTQPQNRFIQRRPKPRRKIGRWIVLGVTFVITLLFLYNFTSQRGFFSVKEISISGIDHYTQNEIITASGLGVQRNNVHTISEAELENQLKQKLSYVKQASISKNVMKRSLMIQITERKPVALLKYRLNNSIRFVLVDLEGFVLEYINLTQMPTATVIIVGDNQLFPQIGDQVRSSSVQLALKLLRSARHLTPETLSRLRTIDANQPDKITLQIDDLPVVWLASDLIETGLHHVNLFLKQQPTLMKKGKQDSNHINGYLDARFQNAIYWGG